MNSNQKPYQPTQHYYIADPSFWPICGSIGVFTTVFGLVQLLHHASYGWPILSTGLGIVLFTMYGWFGAVIKESVNGLHSAQMDKTYRWAMLWFIVSELSLFAVFFLALFYTRVFALPELSDSYLQFAKDLHMTKSHFTHSLLWPDFKLAWPLFNTPNPKLYPGMKEVIDTWEIPALNTLLLLSSAVTVTWAHWGFKKGHNKQIIYGLIATILLGLVFESLQMREYYVAFNHYELRLSSGIYGTTFYTLTGLHALHVSMGIIMLTVILVRCLKGHFLPEHHFAFEAVSWYWHFVDVVWLFLFVFVYWL